MSAGCSSGWLLVAAVLIAVVALPRCSVPPCGCRGLPGLAPRRAGRLCLLGSLLHLLVGHSLSRLPVPLARTAGLTTTYDDHLIIVGDAAGFIDPLTGELRVVVVVVCWKS